MSWVALPRQLGRETYRLRVQFPRQDVPPFVEQLSKREIKVVSALVFGLSN